MFKGMKGGDFKPSELGKGFAVYPPYASIYCPTKHFARNCAHRVQFLI